MTQQARSGDDRQNPNRGGASEEAPSLTGAVVPAGTTGVERELSRLVSDIFEASCDARRYAPGKDPRPYPLADPRVVEIGPLAAVVERAQGIQLLLDEGRGDRPGRIGHWERRLVVVAAELAELPGCRERGSALTRVELQHLEEAGRILFTVHNRLTR